MGNGRSIKSHTHRGAGLLLLDCGNDRMHRFFLTAACTPHKHVSQSLHQSTRSFNSTALGSCSRPDAPPGPPTSGRNGLQVPLAYQADSKGDKGGWKQSRQFKGTLFAIFRPNKRYGCDGETVFLVGSIPRNLQFEVSIRKEVLNPIYDHLDIWEI